MSWTRQSGAAPKYRSRQHRAERKRLLKQLKRDGYLICTAAVCILPTRHITNANGNDPDGLHAGHADNGVDYAGPQHRACNIRDGAVRARAKQTGRHAPSRLIL